MHYILYTLYIPGIYTIPLLFYPLLHTLLLYLTSEAPERLEDLPQTRLAHSHAVLKGLELHL